MNKAIASLALLKANWDQTTQKKDYIQNFVPFIATLIRKKGYEIINTATICKDFQLEYGLSIPYHPMLAILSRAKISGYIKSRPGGNYIPVKTKILEGDFTDIASEQERKYKKVIETFVTFCKETYNETLSEGEAEIVFISFLKDHDLDILFINQELPTLLPEASASITQRHLINSFVRYSYESDPDIFNYLVDISVGHIIANTLSYYGVDEYQCDLKHCNIYLDVTFLFNIMGINGSIKLQAFTDFLQALNSAGASFFIFRHTYDEFQGILEGAIYWIENPSYDPQKASRAATYFIENEFTASDIEQLILQVNERLKELKIKIVGAPGPQEAIEYQIAENELTAIIVEIYKKAAPAFDEVEKESTIYKDVKSVSAILKFRRGEMPTRLQDVKYVFMTTNSSLALASKIFETKISPGNYFFIPTVLTDIFVGTMAWAQSPAAVTEMNKRRLIANCYAALQPTKALVKTMTETADRLRSKGIITVEDVTLLRQSRVARNLLQEETLGDASRFTDKTAIDILEEIRAGVRQEERDKFNKEREGFQLKEQDFYGQIKKEKEKAREIELAHRQTKEELGKIKREKSQIEMNIEALARRLAKRIKVIFTVLAIGMILIALIFQFYPNSASSKWKLFLTITGIVFSILSLITGFNIKGAGDSLQKFVFKITVSLFKRKS